MCSDINGDFSESQEDTLESDHNFLLLVINIAKTAAVTCESDFDASDADISLFFL